MKREAFRLVYKIPAVLRRINRQIEKKKTIVVIRQGVIPRFSPRRDPRFFRLPKSGLVDETREFWFNNVEGVMDLDGCPVRRGNIDLYGGPNPHLTNPISQKMEWLSRVRQRNLFEPHDSPQEEKCRILCARQGDDKWTHWHQNFDFALGCDSALNAPKGLFLLPSRKRPMPGPYERFIHPRCDQLNLVNKRRLARSCQIDVAAEGGRIKWSRYDFMMTVNGARNIRFKRPDIPVILFCHDFWLDDAGYQYLLDWLRPDVLLTAYPTPWMQNFRLPTGTRVVFSPFAPSIYFTRPNLDPAAKSIDLLSIGILSGREKMNIYSPRNHLNEQLRSMDGEYRLEFSHHTGSNRNLFDGPNVIDGPTGPFRYLNQWSSYLGSARYVIFGRLASKAHAFLLGKYYETLGSGAIPIFPEVPDLALLGVRPFEHYIPLSEVEGRDARLKHFLDHYEDYLPIARNAVAWTVENMDRLLFDEFEELIHSLTGRRYPKRVLA